MEYNSFMEALKGKQHKIDKNKNGEIDSHDFKLLRKEESEQLDELSSDALKSYIKGAKSNKKFEADTQNTAMRKNDHMMASDAAQKVAKRKEGIKAAKAKLNSEEVDSLDEIHRMKTKLNALDPVSAKSVARQKLSNLVKSGHGKGALIANKMRTLNMGDDIDQEDLDALHEVLSKDAEAGDWIHDFVHSTNPKFDGKSKKERINMALGAYYDTQKKKDGMSEGNGYDDNRRGFGKPPREDDEYHVPDPEMKKSKMKKEETEQGHHYQVTYYDKDGKAGDSSKRFADKDKADAHAEKGNSIDKVGGNYKVHKVDTPITEGRNEGDVPFDKPYKTVTSPVVKDKSGAVHSPMSRARNLAQMALKKQKAVKEEVQKADIPAYLRKAKGEKPLELKDLKRKDTISDPENLARNRGAVKEEKDAQEYGYEGDMAMNQLATLTRCAEMIKETLKPDTDLPEWVQSKITLATDYIQTAADYLHSELEEQAKPTGPVNVDKVHAAGQEPHEEKWVPAKKVRKESIDADGNVTYAPMTYKDFAMMLEYEAKDGRYVHKGSYGGNYVDPEGADDADDKKPKQQPAVKRGRGRPAGAKSGARKITGTSKLFK